MIIFTEVMAEMVKTVAADKEVRLELSEDKLQITISPQAEESVKTTARTTARTIPQKKLTPNSYTYEFNGETKSAKEWAKIYGVARNTILYRFRHHGSPEAPDVKADDGSTKRTWPIPKLYEWNGRALTAEEWAKEYNCSKKSIQERFYRNGSPEPVNRTKADKRKVK